MMTTNFLCKTQLFRDEILAVLICCGSKCYIDGWTTLACRGLQTQSSFSYI